MKAKVAEFLLRDENSRVMPGKNDKVKVDKQHEQKRVLNDSMSFLHLKYKTETNDTMSFATFCRLRPKNVSLTRYITKNQCLCQRHQNMALTLKCMPSSGATLPVNPDEFARKLEETGGDLSNILESLADTIHHEQWKKVTLDDGKKRTKIVATEVDKNSFKTLVNEQINDFKEHIKRVKQQYKAIGELKQNLPDGHIISQMDFAENFSCSSADEIQSAYWNQNAITLHPVVVYYRENSELKHMNYVFVTDELGHNIGTVYAFLKTLIPDVRQRLQKELKKVYYWTDGPSSQYRNKTAFYLISNHKEVFGSDADWNYFESGHGKGACDGVGGTAKRMADQSIKQGKVSIQDASDFHHWGQEYHKNAKYILVKQEDCEAARKEIDEMNKAICPVKGTLQIHHVVGIEKGKVKTSKTSCYCEQCFNNNEVHTEGEIAALIKEIKPKKQQKRNLSINDAEERESEVDVQGENTVELMSNAYEQKIEVMVGDWVAVNYESSWHIGQIQEVDETDEDCKISFMLRHDFHGGKAPSFKWPKPADEIWVKFHDIILNIKEPARVGRSGRSFSISPDEIVTIEQMLKSKSN